MKNLFLLLAIFISNSLIAQPDRYIYGQRGDDYIQQVVEAPDGNLLLFGSSSENEFRIWLQKVNTNGELIWGRKFPIDPTTDLEFGYGIRVTEKKEILIVGTKESTDNEFRGIFMKTDLDGNIIFKKSYSNTSEFYDVHPTDDGYLISGVFRENSQSSGITLTLNSDGIEQGRSEVAIGSINDFKKIISLPDGNYLTIGRGEGKDIGGSLQYGRGFIFEKTTKTGEKLWQKSFDSRFSKTGVNIEPEQPIHLSLGVAKHPDGGFWVVDLFRFARVVLFHFSDEAELISQVNFPFFQEEEYPFDLVVLQNGNLLISGFQEPGDGTSGFAFETEPTGKIVWKKNYSHPDQLTAVLSGIEDDSGQIWLAGVTGRANSNFLQGILLKPETGGNALPYRIEGQVVFDLNGNCIADLGEPPAKNIFIKTDHLFNEVIATDDEGKFTYFADEGLVVLEPKLFDSNHTKLCADRVFYFDENTSAVQNATFLIQEKQPNCAVPTVSLTEPVLVSCDTANFYVTVSNLGIRASESTSVDVDLHKSLSPVFCSEPFLQDGNLLQIQVPSLPAQGSQIIQVKVKTECDLLPGLAHPISANLKPPNCLPTYSGAKFEVEGFCGSDEIQFEITNVGGGDSIAFAEYRVLVNDLIFEDWKSINLPKSNPTHQLNFPSDGRTWRVEVKQFPNAPGLKKLTAIVENCGTRPTGFPETGYVNVLPVEQSSNDFAAVFPINSSPLPPAILPINVGFGYSKRIQSNQPIEFTARLKNPFQVPITEATFQLGVNEHLDISTFIPKAFPVQPEMEITDGGILTISMENLDIKSREEIPIRFSVSPRPLNELPENRTVDFQVFGAVSLNDGLFSNLEDISIRFDDILIKEDSDVELYDENVLVYDNLALKSFRKIKNPDSSYFLIAGSDEINRGLHRDGILIKFDSEENQEWLTVFDLGDFGENYISEVYPQANSGYLVTGNYAQRAYSTVPFLAKLDSNGKLIWHRLLFQLDEKRQKIGCFFKTSDNDFIVFGDYQKTGITIYEGSFIAKFSPAGDLIWLKERAENNPNLIVELSNGDFVLAGGSWLRTSQNIEKISKNGDLIWSKEVNSEHEIRKYFSLKLKNDGGFTAMGYINIYNGTFTEPPIIVKLEFSPDGILENEVHFGIEPKNAMTFRDVDEIPDGYLVTGYFRDSLTNKSKIFVIRTDENGTPVGEKNYGTEQFSEYSSSLQISGSEAFILNGFVNDPEAAHASKQLLIEDTFPLVEVTDISENLKPEQKQVFVFPNPTSEQIRVSFSKPIFKPLNWQLSTISGKKVKTGRTSVNAFTINLSEFSNGMYILQFSNSDFLARKILVER